MRNLLSLLIVLLLISCKSKSDRAYERTVKYLDSLNTEEYADSMTKSTLKNLFFDTANIGTTPVVVTKAWLVKREYSIYKDVSLTYKNVSGKKISAIRFKWYGIDGFNEPADMGGLFDGQGGGYIDVDLVAGKIRTTTWDVNSKAKKIVKAWAYEVAFDDGTTWKSK